eukprot:gene11677-34399_t
MASAEDAIDLVTNGSEEMTDEGDEEGSTSSSTATTDDNSDNEEGKSTPSKKKKKKKKKKASAGGQTTDANAPAGEPAGPTKAEADKSLIKPRTLPPTGPPAYGELEWPPSACKTL